MKTMKMIFWSLLFPVLCMAQVPQGIKYQVVVRDGYGMPMENQSLSLRISLLEDSTTGVAAYVETHTVSSNAMGLVNLVIGQGSAVSGSFAALVWHIHAYQAKVEIDTAGGSNYTLLGISQLLTVPYAFHAGSADMPSMTQSQRDAILNPAKGMKLFNLSTNCVNIFINNHWREMNCTEWLCGDILLDTRDGQEYPTLQIGTQCWMAKNLNIGSMIIDGHQINNSTIEKCCYSNDANNCATYGGLYQWDEMMGYTITPGTQGICPTGWHIPTDTEWCALTTYLDATVNCEIWGWSGTDAGGKMNETGTTHWFSPNTGATNSSGFTALGAGIRASDGNFYVLRQVAYFWSSSLSFSTYGIYRALVYYDARVDRNYDEKMSGLSVRCLRDSFTPCTPQPDQADAGLDSLNIPGTSVTLQANQPVNGTGVWTVFSGIGGSFVDSSVYNTLFTGQAGTTYTLIWTISNQCGSSIDTVVIGFAFTCGDTLSDTRDGQKYPTVQIGTQCWMAKNLNMGVMVTDHYAGHEHTHCMDNGIIEKYCYNNDLAYCAIYGGLYDWNEMMEYDTTPGIQGICPDGWHIPTDTEWCTMTTYLDSTVDCNVWGWSGMNAGGKMKETGTTYWSTPNTDATNSSRFTALGAGYRLRYGDFNPLMFYASFWSSSEYSSSIGISRFVGYSFAGVYRDNSDSKTFGFSVRCLSNSFTPCTPQPDQADAGLDSLNIPGTSVTLQANQPVNGTGVWTVFSGTGGSFADSAVHNTLFTGQAGIFYTLLWTISNQCGSSIDTVIIGFAGSQAFSCGDTLSDTRDGQKYPTVQIGTQCWMAKNLNIGIMIDGPIDQANNSTIEKYCYDNDTNYCATYGGFYQWDEMMGYTTTPGTQGICPTGWHIPTDAEWCALTTYLDHTVDCNAWGWSGTDAGGKMKATGTTHWYSPNTGATNSSGFTALGAGYRLNSGTFYGHRYDVFFWSSSEDTSIRVIYLDLYYYNANVYRYNFLKTFGFSVRCLRN